MREIYRPTEQQILDAKNGSNELFQYNVPDHLQPNNLRHTENLAGYSGIYHGIMYWRGTPQLPKEKQNGTIRFSK